jgi:N-glycosylase/DNA lyase
MDLSNLQTNTLIEKRLQEFQDLSKKNSDHWFSELCFCILTANSKAQTAINIQKEVGVLGFQEYPLEKIKEIIRQHRHRFHNNKSSYIVAARKFINIKEILRDFKEGQVAREFLVKNIKGLGYKEASHFLRNVGYCDVAIIDRHILKYMSENKLIDQIPKVVTKYFYLECEIILKNISKNLAQLDLIIWQKVTGKVLK